MAMTVRGLMARVKQYRPQDMLESQATFAINESVRRVCRTTWLAQEIILTAPVSAQSLTMTITPTLGDLVGVDRLWMPRLPSSGTTPDYIGTYNGTTGAVTPVNGAYVIADDSAPNFTTNGFYICATAGTITPDDVEWYSEVGDIMYSDGSKWNLIKKGEFNEVSIEAKSTLQSHGYTQNTYGDPTTVSIDNALLTFYPPPKYDTAVLIQCSYVPVGEISGNIPLPAVVEDLIIDGALEIIYAYPGPGQSAKMSVEHGRRFRSACASQNVRARLGQQGVANMMPPDFLGRS